MAYLDEIAAIIEGSTAPLYPQSSGNYWVGLESTDTGLYFADSTASPGLLTFSTSQGPVGFLGVSSGSYLVAFGAAIVGWSVYRGHMPDSVAVADKAIALVNTAGEPEFERVDIEPRGLQVVVRGDPINQTATAYEDAMEVAVSVRGELHEFSGLDPTGVTHYIGVWSENGPFFGGHDQSWRPAFPMNFRAHRQRTT